MKIRYLIGSAALAVGLFAGTSSAGISQLPNQVNGLFSDVTFPQNMADNFVVGDDGKNLGTITWWGGYFANNIPLVPDDFLIKIHDDAGGLPDGLAAHLSVAGVAPARFDTGVDLFGVDEYEYTYDLGSLNLGPGTYWLEIVNNSAQNPGEVWFWETGNLDAVNGIAGDAFSTDLGANWNPDGNDLAFIITNVPSPGALALLGLAGCCGLRRRRN